MAPSSARALPSKSRSSPSSTTVSTVSPIRTRLRKTTQAKPSISTNLNSYDRTDPFAAFNVLLKLLSSLPSRIGGCQYRLTPDEHKLSMHLLSIVEPFVGLSPSRRTLITRQPTEILDAIIYYVDEKRDLLSFALSCKRMHDVVFPRHWEYRLIRCKVSSIRVWNHLSVDRSLARNVRRLEVIDERSSVGEVLPKGIMLTDTDLESTDDELGLHQKQERFLIKAMGRMAGLRSFKWSCNHSPMGIESVWPVLMKFGTLKEVEICDNSVFSTIMEEEEEEEGCKRRGHVLPEMNTVTLRSTHHSYGSTKHPELSRISNMLSHCPNLESLDITYVTPRTSPQISIPRPLADEFILYSRWPHLTSLTLTNLRCSPTASLTSLPSFLFAHPNLEILHIDLGPGAAFPNLGLQSDCLPRLRELHANKEIANAILGCPSTPSRPLETLRGFKLSGSQNNRAADRVFLQNLMRVGKHVKRIELVGWNDMEDLKLLVECTPGLTWFDVGKKLGGAQPRDKSSAAGPVTNIVEWTSLLSDLPDLSVFHGVRFFYEVSCQPFANVNSISMTDRSRIRKNDEIAGVLAWKCKKLRRVDHWEESGGKVIVILRERDAVEGAGGEVREKDKDGSARWDVRRVKQ